ncbi:hypothetical protein IVW58_03000 [Salmonella enterica subsp. enterica serovar Worthington]|nr:hypothetical protein [Salmonella enterica subsp. enterica serovar Worthington]
MRQLEEDIARGITALEAIIGKPVTCSAAAGWRADGRVVRAKEPFNLRYNSDCRGTTLFRPLLMPGQTGTPQIPVTLPTWDEVIGPAVQAQSFNTGLSPVCCRTKARRYIPSMRKSKVLSINRCLKICSFVHATRDHLCPLGELLPTSPESLPLGQIVRGHIPGREGWLGCQQAASAS